MANEYRNLIIGMLLFGLVTILLVSGIKEMGTSYGVSNERINEATGGSLDVDALSTDLTGSDTDAENYRKRFESGNVDNVDDASGLFAVLGTMVSSITTPVTLLAKVMEDKLGIPKVATHILMAIITFLIIFGGWSVLRQGN